MSEEKLNALKKEIKEIDKEIIRLLNQRADFSTEMNTLKLQEGEPLYNGFEEMELMDALEKYADYTNMIQTIYPAILKYARTLYED
jgi:chorismate mutase